MTVSVLPCESKTDKSNAEKPKIIKFYLIMIMATKEHSHSKLLQHFLANLSRVLPNFIRVSRVL